MAPEVALPYVVFEIDSPMSLDHMDRNDSSNAKMSEEKCQSNDMSIAHCRICDNDQTFSISSWPLWKSYFALEEIS